MKKPLLQLLIPLLLINSCKGKQELDQSTPQGVAELMFSSARTGKFEMLKKLCNDQVDADADSRKVCEVSSDPGLQQNFADYFTKGKINGEPVIEGDKAIVRIFFGPDGTKEESLNLVKKDGKWYLESF